MSTKRKKRKLKKGIKFFLIMLFITITIILFLSKIFKNDNGDKSSKVNDKKDTESPVIVCDDIINIIASDDIDLSNIITITDNSLEDIKPIIKGEYDLNKEGEYDITIAAIDSSGNESNRKIKINVLNNVKYNSDGSLVDSKYITNKGFTINVVDGVASVDGIIIVNKTYSLPSDYVPKNPYKAIADRGYCTDCIEDFVMDAFLEMQEDAKKEGLKLWIGSGFRSYSTQVILYNNYANKDGKKAADTYSARAGFSEHQSGLCFDLNSDSDAFTNTKEGKWVNDNAYKYGLIIRFPKDKEDYTGYEYESWHLRYVGKELATKLYNNGNWISLEEYFGITSKYPNL